MKAVKWLNRHAEEVVRYLFVWSGFLSISFTIQNQSAMRLTMAVTALPRMLRHVCIAAVYIMLTAFFGYMSAVAFVQLGSMHQTSAALGMPMVYVYLAPLVGFVLTTVRSMQALAVIFKGFGKHDIVIKTKPEEDLLMKVK